MKTSLTWLQWKTTLIAILAVVGILLHLILHTSGSPYALWPLWGVLAIGGVPLVWDLLAKVIRLEFGADLLGGISIIVSILLGEYLAGAIIVLMLSGGEALESYALSHATSVLSALAKRLPTLAHRKTAQEQIETIPLDRVAVGDVLVIYPHEVAPVDGCVLEGHSEIGRAHV